MIKLFLKNKKNYYNDEFFNFACASPALRLRFACPLLLSFVYTANVYSQLTILPRIIVGQVYPAWSSAGVPLPMNGVAAQAELTSSSTTIQQLTVTKLLTNSQITPLISPTSPSYINDYRNLEGVLYFEFPSVMPSSQSTVKLRLSKNSDWLNGVSTADVVKVQRHVLGTELLTTYYDKIAADVNLDGNIFTSDVLNIKKLILNIATASSIPLPSESWEFLNLKNLINYGSPTSPTGVSFTSLGSTVISNPFAASLGTGGSYPRAILADGANDSPLPPLSGNTPYWVTYQGIKMGDVGGGSRPSVLPGGVSSKKSKLKISNNVITGVNQEIRLKIKCKNFNDIVGFQFPINFDANSLKLKSINSNSSISITENDMGLTDVGKGKMRFAWFSEKLTAKSLSEDESLLDISFITKRPIDDVNELFSFEQNDLPIEFINIEDVISDSNLEIEVETDYSEMKVTTNPFVDNFQIIINSSENNNNAVFSFADINGKVVYQKNIALIKGYQQLDFNDLGNLSEGVLIYSLNGYKGKVIRLK